MGVHSIRGVNYFDDLGDIKTVDGKRIKPNLLFRSGHLNKLKEKSQKKFAEKVDVILDLRTPEEIEDRPDKYLPEVEYHHIPVVENEDNPAVTKENRMKILEYIMENEGGSKAHIVTLYKKIIGKKCAIEGLRKVFDFLIKNKGEKAIDIHCTQGKDRTGVTYALILSALGVAREDVIKMYRAFNRFTWFFKFYVFLGMVLVVSPRKARALDLTLSAKKLYITSLFDELDKEYNGVNNYLTSVIGLSEEDLKTLKEAYTY